MVYQSTCNETYRPLVFTLLSIVNFHHIAQLGFHFTWDNYFFFTLSASEVNSRVLAVGIDQDQTDHRLPALLTLNETTQFYATPNICEQQSKCCLKLKICFRECGKHCRKRSKGHFDKSQDI